MAKMLTIAHNQFIEKDGEFWLDADTIAEALGYATPAAIFKLFERNKGELRDYSAEVKLTSTDGKAYYKRVFNEEGLYLISMLARTAKAKEFRRAVAQLLKELRQKQLNEAKIEAKQESLHIGVELTDLAPMHLINRVCYFRNLGLNQDETAKLTMLYPKTVSQIEAKLRELGVELKKIPHGPRRKADMQNALKLALKGGE